MTHYSKNIQLFLVTHIWIAQCNDAIWNPCSHCRLYLIVWKERNHLDKVRSYICSCHQPLQLFLKLTKVFEHGQTNSPCIEVGRATEPLSLLMCGNNPFKDSKEITILGVSLNLN